ncbi:hypothetical protein BDF14DRAFT_679741 [Spinellus fusiger]|nr:hypothetical protein BDF14DRAFT_679741 [Spinellus fusiger]
MTAQGLLQLFTKQLKHPENIEALLNESERERTLKNDINKRDLHGDTIVHYAARAHSLAVLKTLYHYGADMEAVNGNVLCIFMPSM